MMLFTRTRLVLLLAVIVAGLIVFLPARLLESPLNTQLGASTQVSLRGTIWNGSGLLQSPATSIPFAWKFEPSALLKLRASWRVQVTSPSLTGSASVGLGFSNVEIRNADVSLDASSLSQLHPTLSLAQLMAPSGRLALTVTDSFKTAYGNALSLRGEAMLKANELTLATLSLQPLGSYQIKFTGRDNVLDFAITESRGALKLDGSGNATLTSPRQLSYAGHATVADLPESFINQLKSISQPLPDGRLRIDYKGRW